MSTIIYPSPIFGPVHSRRLGISLGINLLPSDGKLCFFDCIYCECGFNADHRPALPMPTREQVRVALELKLSEMKATGMLPDVLTFAGNGEPTVHPKFPEIIADTLYLRDRYCPSARVSVLSNATMVHRKKVREALLLVDNNIQKLDTVSPDYIRALDRPVNPRYRVDQVVENLKWFEGHVIIQTIFLKSGAQPVELENGRMVTTNFDNTAEEFVLPWLEAIGEIRPQSVMVYTIDRETPAKGLLKAPPEVLNQIRDRVIAMGIPCTASY